jgi:autotransporter-associated beta strand protein
LGDANTGSNNVSLLTGGAFEIKRGVAVTNNGTGIITIGGNTDNNSTFSGAVSLAKNVNISQVATTGSNAVTFSGVISGTGFGVSKVGAGKAILSAANTYTGDTKVLAGTLSLTNNDLENAADVFLTSNAFLDLNFGGTDIIDSLFVDGVMQVTGTWGGAGSGAAHISPWITGSGLLSITTGAASPPGDYNLDGSVNAADYVVWRKNPAGFPANAYDVWRASFGNPPGSGSGLDGAAVPEPGAAVIAIGLCIAAAANRRNRCSARSTA